MLISPPFLPLGIPCDADASDDDPMMTFVEAFEQSHGIYPIAFDRRTHCGVHLLPNLKNEPVRAIADGEVVAYRVANTPIHDSPKSKQPNSNNGFVLLKHATDTGEGRTLTFYSLYMHLLDLAALNDRVRPPAHPLQPDDSSPTELPAWLLTATDGSAEGKVLPGHGKKVRRKDVLGYLGANHGLRHLHVEIFMTETDFESYFGATQLGRRTPQTPATTDVWGHSYYVIPGGSRFCRTPKDYPLDATDFPPLQDGTLDAAHTLYVEAYFCKGQRYTRSWLDQGQGHRLPLNGGEAERDGTDYEYTLYDRATRYYPACPSDGYELLRFGRILSTPATLRDGSLRTPPPFMGWMDGNPRAGSSPDPRITWVPVRFGAGPEQRGYIDINDSDIQKLSDADFPLVAGWQKIADGNTPFDADGLCDYSSLLTFVGDGSDPLDADATPATPRTHDEQVQTCLTRNDDVRAALSGFVCRATSEWDSSLTATRYAGLNEPGGFFYERRDTDPNGFQYFQAFLKKLQFIEQVPGFTAGQKFWFFHPLKFIRYFRRCGWLSEKELIQTLPTSAMRPTGYGQFVSERINLTPDRTTNIQRTYVELNVALRKFNIAPNPWRMAAFLANAFVETEWLQKFYEKNPATWYYPWDGRGFLQLTEPENYFEYWTFLGRDVSNDVKDDLNDASAKAHASYEAAVKEAKAARQREDKVAYAAAVTKEKTANAPLQDDRHPTLTPQMIQWRHQVETKAIDATQSAGAYWAKSKAAVYADESPTWTRTVQYPTGSTKVQVYYRSEGFGQVAATINVGHPVADPRSAAGVNGIVARFQAYTHAVAILADDGEFPDKKGQPQLMPDGFERRKDV